MEKVVLDVPALWADHHVLKVRDALANLDGVQDIYASSAWKQVMVTFEDGATDTTTIEEALAKAGYPVGEGELPVLVQPLKRRRDPQWEKLGFRTTTTSRVDLEMSGEFRKY